jgi:ketosteroid isomerase-like protein
MRTPEAVVGFVAVMALAGLPGTARPALAQASTQAAETARIMKADADFAESVAGKDRARFLSFLADVTTFNGGSSSELHGRDAVMKEWNDFFTADGPTLSWTPARGEVVGAGDLGYTTGRSLFRGKGPDGRTVERRGEYLTVWRKQRDGSWKVIFDTGSTLPAVP